MRLIIQMAGARRATRFLPASAEINPAGSAISELLGMLKSAKNR
jgi:hypothetical protein